MEANTGTDYEGFKIPSSIPQDILLIQDLVGPIIPSTQPVTSSETDPVDSIDSSGESTDSVEEVEANLISEDWKATRSVS
jgi:H/ACA ribonucleoprotein complex non-core subunit NAF1